MKKQITYYVSAATGRQWIFTTSGGGARARTLLKIFVLCAGDVMKRLITGNYQKGKYNISIITSCQGIEKSF